MTRSERFRENVSGWVFLAGAYGASMVVTIAATLILDRQVAEFAESLILVLVSTFVFWMFSFGILFRHRRAAAPVVLFIGAVIGSAIYLLAWLLWRNIEPSFRHAIPIELLPMFVLPIITGVTVGIGLYFASIEQPANSTQPAATAPRSS